MKDSSTGVQISRYELVALHTIAVGTADRENIPGIARTTVAKLLEKGLIERMDEVRFGQPTYRLTPQGKDALTRFRQR
ncbi:hypothetical protein [Limoniibacter endophyticus]|uniref:Uncharacterized protein n=1 Tax=Limoniibacter endophyticus TaxID=1565040 RepID=A0A8J3DLD9_9HYPH|nr:hypothetical protein [Limoniibacter endophyticus]GHC79277.1 hypothetical protein GCM10010136_31700 [Limoniibacter endophyticus]